MVTIMRKTAPPFAFLFPENQHLTPAEIGAYLGSTLTPDTIDLLEDHLRRCPRCAAEVAFVRATLTEDEEADLEALVAAIVEDDIRVAPRSNLRMVAATSEADLEETSEPIIFAEITLGEATYQFAEPPRGPILLSGPISPDATHIHFGRDQYTLSPTDRPEWYQIESVGRADISDYLVDYRQEPADNPIWIGLPQ